MKEDDLKASDLKEEDLKASDLKEVRGILRPSQMGDPVLSSVVSHVLWGDCYESVSWPLRPQGFCKTTTVRMSSQNNRG